MLRVIKAAQRLGFTLEEVADLLDAGRTITTNGRIAASPTARRPSWSRWRPRSPTYR